MTSSPASPQKDNQRQAQGVVKPDRKLEQQTQTEPKLLAVQRASTHSELLTPTRVVAMQQTLGNRSTERVIADHMSKQQPRPTQASRSVTHSAKKHKEDDGAELQLGGNLDIGGRGGVTGAGANPPDVPLATAAQSVRRIQAKLTVGAANDTFEQDADAMATFVMRKLRTDEAGNEPAHDSDALAQTSTSDVSRLDSPGVTSDLMGSFDVGTELESAITNVSGGNPLPGPLQRKMELGFDSDFSNVRIHTSPHAAELSRTIQAKAFTHGADLFFDAGAFEPGTSEGQELIAHELRHVQQQGAATRRKHVNQTPVPSVQARRNPEAPGPSKGFTIRNPDGSKRIVAPGEQVNILSEETRQHLNNPLGGLAATSGGELTGLDLPSVEEERSVATVVSPIVDTIIRSFNNEVEPDTRVRLDAGQLVDLLRPLDSEQRRAVRIQFQARDGRTLRQAFIEQEMGRDRKSLVRALCLLELGADRGPVLQLGLALIPLGTRDASLFIELEKRSIAERKAIQRRYGRTFSGIGLAGQDTLVDHLKNDLSGASLHKALALLDHAITPAENLFFALEGGLMGAERQDAVKVLLTEWEKGLTAFRQLDTDWTKYVNNDPAWTTEPWSGESLLKATHAALYQTAEWQQVRGMFETLTSDFQRDDARELSKRVAGQAGWVDDGSFRPSTIGPVPTGEEESIWREEEIRRIAAEQIFAGATDRVGTDEEPMRRALELLRAVWEARIKRAQSRKDSAAEQRYLQSWNERKTQIEQRLRGEIIAEVDAVEGLRARMLLAGKLTDADEIWLAIQEANYEKAADLATKAWARGAIAQLRKDASVGTVDSSGKQLRPGYDAAMILPGSSLAVQRYRTMVQLDGDIESGLARMRLELPRSDWFDQLMTTNDRSSLTRIVWGRPRADSDLAGLLGFLSVMDNRVREAVLTQFITTRAPNIAGETTGQQFVYYVAWLYDPGNTFYQIANLADPKTEVSDILIRKSQAMHASEGGTLNYLLRGVGKVVDSFDAEGTYDTPGESLQNLEFLRENEDRPDRVAAAYPEADVTSETEPTPGSQVDVLAQGEGARFDAYLTSLIGSNNTIASLLSGAVEIIAEFAVGCFTGGAGMPAVINSVIATMASFGANKLLLGDNYKLVSYENAKGVASSFLDSYLFEIVDFRKYFADNWIHHKEGTLINSLKVLAETDKAKSKLYAGMIQNAFGAAADSVVSTAVSRTLDAVLLDKLPSGDDLFKDALSVASQAVTRAAMAKVGGTATHNPQALHDFMPDGERLVEDLHFKVALKTFVNIGKYSGEIAANWDKWDDPKFMSDMALKMLRGFVSSTAKGGLSAVQQKIEVRKRLGRVDQLLGARPEVVEHLISNSPLASEPKYLAEYNAERKRAGDQAVGTFGQFMLAKISKSDEKTAAGLLREIHKEALIPTAEFDNQTEGASTVGPQEFIQKWLRDGQLVARTIGVERAARTSVGTASKEDVATEQKDLSSGRERLKDRKDNPKPGTQQQDVFFGERQ